MKKITHCSLDYEKLVKGPFTCTDFASLVQSENNPFPNIRIQDYMVLGPFILETDGAFETEYLYEREKVLECDYLSSSGGERALVPFLGKREKNNYYSEEFAKWEKGMIKWDQLRFDTAENERADMFFKTEQRNCVYYASFYVRCEKESDAVICYENSGSLLYLNGELIDSKPYGRTKGIETTGNRVAVTFRAGLNLVMFKIRVGYICDTFDFGMSFCTVYPVLQRHAACGITSPGRTSAYLGTVKKPREVFPFFAGAFGGDCPPVTLEYSAAGYTGKIEIPAMKKGETAWLRYSVPTGKAEKTECISVKLGEAVGSTYVHTLPYCGFEGSELIDSSFHFDTTYHQEQRTYAMGALYITKCMAEKLRDNPRFKAVLSEVDYLHPFCSVFPEYRRVITDAFASHRAEADCFYNQPNDLTSSGEGFIRNLVYGQLYHRDVLGGETPVYSPGDVFGHCNQLSQICSKGGVRVLRWGKTIWGLDAAVRQMSPDGTALINDRCLWRESAMKYGFHASGESSHLASYYAAYPQNEDTSWQDETITKARHSVFSELDLTVAEDDRRTTEKDGVSKLDLSSRDITQHHSGVLLTRTDFKQANRLCENLLITAEKFSAMAALCGARYPEKALDKAWRQVLCAQHHDSVTGTNNEISFIDLMIEYREAAELAADIIKRACTFIAENADAHGEYPIFVFNPHTWKRRDICEITLPLYAESGFVLSDCNGKTYDFVIISKTENALKAYFTPNVPALGYAVYTLKKSDRALSPVSSRDNSDTIENEYYRIRVDAALGGGIVSLYDKKAKREVIADGCDGPANRVVVIREVPDRMETQHEIYTTGQKLFSSDYPATVTCEKNALCEKLTVTVKLDVIATVRQEITLTRGVKRIDMKTVTEDYQARDDLFTLTFPVNVKGGLAVYDDRCAAHIAGKSKNKLSFKTHQHASYSHSRILPSNQWAELGPTLTARVRGRGSFNIGMTSVIRHETKELVLSAETLLTALTKKAVPVTVFPDGEQHSYQKVIHFNEDLTNTDTRFVLSLDGTENLYENKLLSELKEGERQRFTHALSKNGIAVLVTRDCDNIFKKPIVTVLIKAASCEKLTAYIKDLSDSMAPSRAFTLKADVCACALGDADDYGIAIINNGTIACSVEGENMLNMMLFHTADFYGNHGKVTSDGQLVPEQKTHCFTYALYPHDGSYVTAGVYKKAYEFNDGLFSLSEVSVNGKNALPEKISFMECDGDFLITAVKAGGYPLASMKGNIGDITQRGIALRGFEPDGAAGVSKIKLGFSIDSLYGVNLLEEEKTPLHHLKRSFEIHSDACSIDSFSLGARRILPDCDKIIGAQAEPVQPVYVRSWEHDSGSLPMGYMASAGVISRKTEKLDDTTYRMSVSMANNRTDKSISGEMTLILPEGFKASKTVFPYNVEAGGVTEEYFTVTKPSTDAKGVTELRYTDEAQQFFDIYEFGYFNPEVTLTLDGGTVTATLINNTGSALRGELSIASPFESWSVGGFNRCALFGISPRTVPVEIADGERKEYVFTVSETDTSVFKAYWAAVKLMVNGRIHFGFARLAGEHHNRWTHEYWNRAVGENNGSLKKILEED